MRRVTIRISVKSRIDPSLDNIQGCAKTGRYAVANWVVEIIAEDEGGPWNAFVRKNGKRDAVLVVFVGVGRKVG